MQRTAFTKSGNDKLLHLDLITSRPTNGAMGEAMVHVHGFLLEMGEALFGLVGEFLHHGGAAVVAQGVFEHALALLIGF